MLKRDGPLAKVYYLDYGNSESLPLSSIFAIPPAQLATQMLSVRCRCHLASTHPTSSPLRTSLPSVYQWPELGEEERARARARLDSYTSSALSCRVVSTEGDSFTSARTLVQLYLDSKDLGEELRAWALRPEEPAREVGYSPASLGAACEVFLSYQGRGPHSFHVQRADQAQGLARLMEEVSSLECIAM